MSHSLNNSDILLEEDAGPSSYTSQQPFMQGTVFYLRDGAVKKQQRKKKYAARTLTNSGEDTLSNSGSGSSSSSTSGSGGGGGGGSAISNNSSGGNLGSSPSSSSLFGSSPKAAPAWVPDADVNQCSLCTLGFSLVRRRKHHCRNCGGVFCDSCSAQRYKLGQVSGGGSDRGVRVCFTCYRELLAENPRLAALEEETWRIEEQQWIQMACCFDPSKPDKKLLTAIRAGIPPRIRATCWPLLSRSWKLQEANVGVYQRLVQQQLPSMSSAKIHMDVDRTFPHHPMFHDQHARGQKMLFNILAALSLHEPQLGYQQGMSYFGAVLLLNVDEEAAFWLLLQLMREFSVAGFFSDGAPTLHLFLAHFSRLFIKILPDLHLHLKQERVFVETFAQRWFSTLFAYDLPLPFVFRLWDIFFVEGPDCVIKLALALLCRAESTLLCMGGSECLSYLQDISPLLLHEADALFDLCDSL